MEVERLKSNLSRNVMCRLIAGALAIFMCITLFSEKIGKVEAGNPNQTRLSVSQISVGDGADYIYDSGVLKLKTDLTLNVNQDFSCSVLDTNGYNLIISGSKTLTCNTFKADGKSVKLLKDSNVVISGGYMNCGYLETVYGSTITINSKDTYCNNYSLYVGSLKNSADISITSGKGGIYSSGESVFSACKININSADTCVYLDSEYRDSTKFNTCTLNLKSEKLWGVYSDDAYIFFSGETDNVIESKLECIHSAYLDFDYGNYVLTSSDSSPMSATNELYVIETYIKSTGKESISVAEGGRLRVVNDCEFIDEPCNGVVVNGKIYDENGNEAVNSVLAPSYQSSTIKASEVTTNNLIVKSNADIIMDVPLTVNRIDSYNYRNITIKGSEPLTVKKYISSRNYVQEEGSSVEIKGSGLLASESITIAQGSKIDIDSPTEKVEDFVDPIYQSVMYSKGGINTAGDISVSSKGSGIYAINDINITGGSISVNAAKNSISSEKGNISIDESLKIHKPENGSVESVGKLNAAIVDNDNNASAVAMIKDASYVEKTNNDKIDDKKNDSSNNTTSNDSNSNGNNNTNDNSSADQKDDTSKPNPTYKNEWVDGKWYNENGVCEYAGTLTWKCNATGWWVEDSEGWYPVSQWQKIDGKWYYFTETGYMAYSEYRDGYWLGSDGALVDGYKGEWKSDGSGWWFEDESGWYPVSQWLWIDGKCYYFEADGYLATSKYIDGYWVGSDGAYSA